MEVSDWKTDPLTGLPSFHMARAFADRRLKDRRNGSVLRAICIDLDGFRRINESFGYAAGDEILKLSAARIRQTAGGSGFAARVGADKFMVLLEDAPDSANRADGAEAFCEGMLRRLSEPYEVSGTPLFLTASIGVADGAEANLSADLLLMRAEAAMRRAKETGNCVVRYREGMPEWRKSAFNLLNELQRGVRRREFTLHYQPQFDLSSGRMLGLEALIRWNHPERGLLSAGEFVPISEQTGLIVQLDMWMLGEACRQLEEWREEGYPDVRLSVNLSARSFRDERLAGIVAGLMAKHAIKPGQLEIELTESAALKHPDEAVRTLGSLKKLGVSIALDDFGSEYSSLSYLKQLPVDRLKIDQSFVRGMADSEPDRILTEMFVDLAHRLGLKTVGEGVESERHLAMLKDIGCDCAQGYWLGRPLPAAEAEKLLAASASGRRGG